MTDIHVVQTLAHQRDQDVRQASRAWERRVQALVLVHVRDLLRTRDRFNYTCGSEVAETYASIVPMRGDLALEVQSQERGQEQEDSLGLPSLVLLVCGRLARLGERDRMDHLLGAVKLREGVEAAVPEATSRQ